MRQLPLLIGLLLAPLPLHAEELDLDALTTISERARERGSAPGLSVAVMVGDELVFARGFGLADLEHEVPVRPETVFRIASLTKQFTSSALLKLVEEQKLSLADDFTNYVDAFDPGARTISVRQLLDHTSGIPSVTDLETWRDTRERRSTPAEVIGLLEGVEFDFEPGTQWAYNNSAYIIAGLVLEERAGTRYEQALADMLFVPLGLESLRYENEGDLVMHRARGYARSKDGPRNATTISMTQPFAAGALLANASDLVRWEHALVSGRVLSEASFQELTRPATLANGEAGQSGLGLFTGELHGRRWFDHSGGIQGFSSFLAYVPERELGVAVLSNIEGFQAGQLARELATQVLLPEIEDLEVPPELEQALIGRYESDELNLQVRKHSEGLRASIRGLGMSRLRYQGDGQFRWAGDLRRRLCFEQAAGEGRVVRVEFEGVVKRALKPRR